MALYVKGMLRLWKTRSRFSFVRKVVADGHELSTMRYDCKCGRLDGRAPALICAVSVGIPQGYGNGMDWDPCGYEVFTKEGFAEFVSEHISSGDTFSELK